MDKVVLNATKRDVLGKQVKALRRAGKLPAVIYGRHTEPISINLEAHTASQALAKLTSSSLVTLNVDGTEYPASVRETLRTSVRVHFIGVSGEVKDLNAVMVHNLEQLEVECLPNNLPERIDVDISSLAKPGDSIRVREVQVPDTIRLLNDPDTVVAVATFAKVEEEVAAVPGAEAVVTPTGTEPELSVERGKKEEEGEEQKKK